MSEILTQVFRIGDTVRVRQDGAAPSEWCEDWADARLKIVGTLKDEDRPGRVCYFVHADGDKRYADDPMAEDWLEPYTNGFLREDYRFTADLLRRHGCYARVEVPGGTDSTSMFRATCYNNLGIILAALDKAGMNGSTPINADAKTGDTILAWGPHIGHRVVFYNDGNSTHPWGQEDGDSYRRDAFIVWWKLPEATQ